MKSLGKLVKYTLKYKWAVMISIIAMLAQVIGGFLIPSYMRTILDEALPYNDLSLLQETGLIMIAVAFVSLIAGVVKNFTSQKE